MALKLSDEDANKYKEVTEKFTEYFLPKTNVIFERSKFNLRCEQTGETVEQFVTELYKLAEKCNFEKFGDDLKDELIRDRLVIGLVDKRINEMLQIEDQLTLEKAIQIARQSEEIKRQSISTTIDRVHKANRRDQHSSSSHFNKLSSAPSSGT